MKNNLLLIIYAISIGMHTNANTFLHTSIDLVKSIDDDNFVIDMHTNANTSLSKSVDLDKGIIVDDIFTDMYISDVYRLAKNIIQSYGLTLKLDEPFDKWHLCKDKDSQESYSISMTKDAITSHHDFEKEENKPNNNQEILKKLETFFFYINHKNASKDSVDITENNKNVYIYYVVYSVDNKTPKLEFFVNEKGYHYAFVCLYKGNQWILINKDSILYNCFT